MKLDKPKTVGTGRRKKSTVILAIGGYFNTGIQIIQGLLLIPLYIKYIGLHLYGLWLASGGILAMLGVLGLGFGTLLTQRVAQAYGQQDYSKAGSYFINGLAVYLILASAFVGVGLIISFNLDSLLKEVGADEKLLRACFQVAIVSAGLALVNESLRSFANALLRPLYFMLALIIARISGLALTVFLLLDSAGLWAIPLGLLFSECIALLFGVLQGVTLYRELDVRCHLNIQLIKEFFKIGGMLFSSRLGHALSRESDPLLINFFFRPEVTAAYMVIRRAADMVFQMLSVIYAAMFGSFSHLAGGGDDIRTGRVAAQFLVMSFVFGLIGFVGYAVLDESFVKLWVGNIFNVDKGVVLWIGAAYFLNNLRNMILQLINGLGEFWFSSRVILIEGGVRVALALLLLSWLGLAGAPLSLAIVCLITLIILGTKLYNRIPIALPHRIIAKSFILSGLLFGFAVSISSYLIVGTWWKFVIFAIVCVTVTATILALTHLNQIKMLRHI